MAEALTGRVRDSDLLCRLGGDEFALLMTDGDAAAAQRLATEISELLRRCSANLNDVMATEVSASIGIALFDDREHLSARDILAEADQAMYTAKRQGRSRIASRATETRTHRRQVTRLKLRNTIDTALREERFELYLQPIMDVRTQMISSYETLLRLRDDDGAMIAPQRFLYVAERFDQIQAIDDWVIEHATGLLSRLHEDQSLEINLSGRSLGDPRLAPRVSELVGRSGADPSRVIFEITETAAIENMQGAREFANRLTALGCRFALDDFGAGFGTFYYLKHLPFEYIKINGEFIRKAIDNRTDQLIVRSCVELARGLDKRTIAEFVEDEETLHLITTLGVDQAQGYAIGLPLPVDQTPGLLPAN